MKSKLYRENARLLAAANFTAQTLAFYAFLYADAGVCPGCWLEPLDFLLPPVKGRHR